MRTPADLFNKIWNDIKNAENYDLYLVLLAAIIVIILDLLSVPVKGVMDSVTLAILALVTVGLLGNRWRLEQIREAVGAGRPVLLDHDAGVDKLFEQAHEVWLMGVSRSTTIARQFPAFEKVLRRGGKIRVLLVDPRGKGTALAGDRHYVPTDESRCRAIIYRAISDLSRLRQWANDEDSLKVAILEFVPAFSLTMVNPDMSNGVIQVQLYSHWMRVAPTIPQLLLSPRDSPWYGFYRKQMETLWKEATEWDWNWPADELASMDLSPRM